MRFSEQAMLEISRGRMNLGIAESRGLSGYVRDELHGEVWPLLRSRKANGARTIGGALVRLSRFLRGAGEPVTCLGSSETAHNE